MKGCYQINMSTSHRPVIGISPSVNSEGFIRMKPTYLNAVWAAGGIPVYLAYTEDEKKLDEYADCFDGFLFAGGVDIDPKYYGEKIEFDSVEICPARDDFELALAKRVIPTGKPILGICRGIQLLNVACGGSLYQHIEGHRQEGNGQPQHTTVLPDTLLYSIVYSGEIMTNSYHHQAVREVAPTLKPAAFADDGICEAVYMPGHPFFLGVQWHPEMFFEESDSSANIFRAFVRSAQNT